MTRMIVLGAAGLLAACSAEESAADGAVAEAGAQEQADQIAAAPDEAPERAYRYTSLAECEVVREEREEMPFVETLCPGPAGWTLRVTDSDARQNVIVVAPGGRETSLELSRIGGGGFSSLGEAAEWRGPAGPDFAPDSLIVRYRVAEKAPPEPETAYLLAIDLTPRPCVIARVAPGPAQNEVARTRADDPGTCL